jgi:archaellum component FlaC
MNSVNSLSKRIDKLEEDVSYTAEEIIRYINENALEYDSQWEELESTIARVKMWYLLTSDIRRTLSQMQLFNDV